MTDYSRPAVGDTAPGVSLAIIWPIAATALGLALAVLAFGHFREEPPAVEMVRFEIPAKGINSQPLLSPDGKRLAYTVREGPGISAQLWLHIFESNESRPLPGTEGARAPFWLPDSRFLGYFDLTNGKLQKVDVAGGSPQSIADLDENPTLGGTWTRDDMGNGVILFPAGGGIMRVPETGGTPSRVTIRADGESFHAGPNFLPDGRHFLYTRFATDRTSRAIYIGSLDMKPEAQSREKLADTDASDWYAPSADGKSGCLLFTRGGSLLAQPFDPRSLKLSGKATPIAEGLLTQTPRFSASKNVLAYRAGANVDSPPAAEGAPPPPVTVLLNWQTLMRR